MDMDMDNSLEGSIGAQGRVLGVRGADEALGALDGGVGAATSALVVFRQIRGQ